MLEKLSKAIVINVSERSKPFPPYVVFDAQQMDSA